MRDVISWLPGLSSVVRAGGLVLALQGAGYLARYGLHVTLGRLLGVSRYGTFSLVMALSTIVAVFASLGVPDLLLRLIPPLAERGVKQRVVTVARKAADLITISAGCCFLLGIALWLLVWDGPLAGSWGIPAALALMLGPFLAAERFGLQLARSLMLPATAYSPQNLIRPLGALGLVVLVSRLAGPLTPTRAVCAVAVAVAVGLSVQVLVVRRQVENAPAVPPSSFDLSKTALLLAALPLGGMGLIDIVSSRADILMMGALQPRDLLGEYSAAVTVATAVRFVLVGLVAVTGPRLSMAVGNYDKSLANEVARTTVRVGCCFAAGVAVVLILWSRDVLSLFGPGYANAAAALRIAALGQVVTGSFGMTTTALVVTEMSKDLVIGASIIALGTIGLGILLIPALAAIGAALAWALASAAGNLYMAWRCERERDIRVALVGLTVRGT